MTRRSAQREKEHGSHVDPTHQNDCSVSREATEGVPVARRRKKSSVEEYAEAILMAVVLALVIRTFVVQAFTIPSGSMMDTLQVGDYILVNKFIYGAQIPYTPWSLPGLRAPERGEIVVFKYPLDERRDFIKRIIASGGDRLVIRDGQVFINRQPISEQYVQNPGRTLGPPPYVTDRNSDEPCLAQAAAAAKTDAHQFGPITIPEGHYFVMGDNRNNSQDSRYWGCLKREHIRGKAFMIYWSWNREKHWPRWGRLGKIIRRGRLAPGAVESSRVGLAHLVGHLAPTKLLGQQESPNPRGGS
ncbi:MAG: signal peptidase I [Candidatus Methylomirabilia bacterium]